MSNMQWTLKPKRLWISDEIFFSTTELEGEAWLDFDSFRNHQLAFTYQVSNKGRIRKKGEVLILKGQVTFDGYHEVYLKCSSEDDYNELIVKVHRIVLSLFGYCPSEDVRNLTVQHLNHDKLDNRIENLCWMTSYENNQEGHGVKTKIVDSTGAYYFNSQKEASCYLGRYSDYVAECVKNGYKVTNASKQEVEVYLLKDHQWTKYCRPVPNNRKWCKIVEGDQEHNFESFLECDRFLNKPEGYTANCVQKGWPITDFDSSFYIYNTEDCCYSLYCPKREKKKASIECAIESPNGSSQYFSSIASLASYLNRDPEYVRTCLKDNRPVKDAEGNVVKIKLQREWEMQRK